MLEIFINGVLILSGFVVVFTMIMIYNRIVSYQQSAKSAMSSISVELKRRENLIPEIIKSVKGFVKHEDELMSKLTKLRSSVSGEFLKTFLAVAENYPMLKSSELFLQLQNTLEETENNIVAARHIYNTNVDYYNSLINSFPAVLYRFTNMPYLEFETQEYKGYVPTYFSQKEEI